MLHDARFHPTIAYGYPQHDQGIVRGLGRTLSPRTGYYFVAKLRPNVLASFFERSHFAKMPEITPLD